MEDNVIDWLLVGDVSIQYQTYRDLLEIDRPVLQKRIATEGWGARFIASRNSDGSWGSAFYQPKWISDHYTLLDLKALCVFPEHPLIRERIHQITCKHIGPDGGILVPKTGCSDVCVNGMFWSYACYFGEPQACSNQSSTLCWIKKWMTEVSTAGRIIQVQDIAHFIQQ